VVVLLAGCAVRPPARPAPAVPTPLTLKVYLYLDHDFTTRFGPASGSGGEHARRWLEAADRQISAQFPLRLRLAGIGAWALPPGAVDGKVIFTKYAPHTIPPGADCLIALTGRRGVYWSGISQWPRVFLKAQAAEPVDEKTVALLCHEISHWFGMVDIIDASFPERSVMNYKDKRFGMVKGRVVWDRANRERLRHGLSTWPDT
jgi:hypothetical protein